MTPLSVAIIVLFLFALVELTIINLILPFFYPLGQVALIADIFNKTAIGFGALIAGIGGFKYLESYIEKEKINLMKKMYQKLYPENQIGKERNYKFSVIHKPGSGKLYLHDREKGTKRHIGNYDTFVELGWSALELEELPEETFSAIKDERNPIIITGKIGT